MIEINRAPVSIPSGDAAPSSSVPEDETPLCRLLYSKSKVYVNPTAYARDNIPGFVALVKQEHINPVYLLAWIPETLLNERGREEWDKFVRIESRAQTAGSGEEDEDAVLIDLPTSRPESYAFSVPLTSIYSMVVHPPSLASWYGSVAINLITGATLPTLYFHDDESKSIQSQASTLVDVGGARRSPVPSWGGDDLLSRIRQFAHILRSTLQPSLYLIDPSRADIETHTTHIFSDDAVDAILTHNSHSPVPAHLQPRPLTGQVPTHRASLLHRSLSSSSNYPPSSSQSLAPASQARAALLQSFSSVTRATRHAAQTILSHPLAKPIVPHLPDPVKSLVNANGEWSSWVEKSGVGEYEGARVYLARWARVVAEEGERARMRESASIPRSSSQSEEDSSLGVFELLNSSSNLPTPKPTRDPTHPVDLVTWRSWFDETGRGNIPEHEMRKQVFRRGLTPEIRAQAWPFILGVMPWSATTAERRSQWNEKREQYYNIKAEWQGNEAVYNREDVVEERHRIDVDCRRTDRTQPLFSQPSMSPNGQSSFSPDQNDGGSQPPSNDHVDRLATILLSYNFYEKDLGYVQGMSDLCAPIYVVMAGEEEITFWCFVEVMNRMKQNFLRDQSGMKKQLSTLQQLLGIMDPELYRHLEKADGLNLFFCFRWVLINFKREFPFGDVIRLWEVLWTDYLSNNFVLFVALAVLESHRSVIIRYLVEFDEILKYCNDLSSTIELDSTLAQAEVLFLSFAQLVGDLDRRRAEAETASDLTSLRRRKGGEGKEAQDSRIPGLSEELRCLLHAGR
ncbi:GTPase-activating protein gyp7 [Sistotremastrum niveocremeum HHB9708]|uniref:GTPase-activating protein gyp7 n=1 Tax=Sistotremastrum niveocremeum HHB9708 TaxID=1314777 RepID=A0A165AMA8_9AGAM|nr:GTPase-activating protein gyp7 [Sistotremastrum niveocremeum HHB9708]